MWLIKLGANVTGLSKGVPSNPSMFKELDLENKITYYEKNILDLEAIKLIIEEVKPDYLFHLAAQALVSVSYSNPVETISTNVLGTMNVLEALKESNHNCVGIIITSDKCYDNVEWEWGYRENDALGGPDPYSASKGAAEIAIRSYVKSYFSLCKN